MSDPLASEKGHLDPSYWERVTDEMGTAIEEAIVMLGDDRPDVVAKLREAL